MCHLLLHAVLDVPGVSGFQLGYYLLTFVYRRGGGQCVST